MTVETLKDCPFCGGRGEVKRRFVRKYEDDDMGYNLETRFVIRCVTCNATTRLSFTKEDASEMWNRRTK